MALALVIGQGLVVLVFLLMARSIGAYTHAQRDLAKALLDTHEINLLVHQRNLQVLEALRQMPSIEHREVA